MRKVLVDMHVAPATRRWGARLSLALALAAAIGYIPSQVLARDARVPGLQRQVEEFEHEISGIEARNLTMIREIEALRADVRSIERRARMDLGMVYPHELVLRLPRPGEQASLAPSPSPSSSPSSSPAPSPSSSAARPSKGSP